MKNHNSDFDKSLLFEEEVKDEDLVDKKNHSDIIYVESDNNGRKKILIYLFILLIFIFLISSILGLLFSKDKVGKGDFKVNNYDLFVTHTNFNYGADDLSLEKYDSYNNAYSYNFSISNSNSIKLNYSIEFVNSNYEVGSFDMPLINYSLLKNGVQVSTGTLENKSKFALFSGKINENTNDIFSIKLWSKDVSNKFMLDFKINVTV